MTASTIKDVGNPAASRTGAPEAVTAAMNTPITNNVTAKAEHAANRCFQQQTVRAGHVWLVLRAQRPPATALEPTISPTSAPMKAGMNSPTQDQAPSPTIGIITATPVTAPVSAARLSSLSTQLMEQLEHRRDPEAVEYFGFRG
ncbi:hypothetical protein H351_09755 [Rhodococcus erythropolis R138]|nr:hypothetical protein H351_09755 [Rhodococcus erythropolis R138]